MRKTHFIIKFRYLMIIVAVGLFTCFWTPGVYQPSVKVAEAKQPGQADIKNKEISAFYSVMLEPAKVAEGKQVVVKAVFSISENDFRDTLPVEYFYEIHKQNVVVFNSPNKKLKVGNGAKSTLEIKAEAFGGKGDYKLVLLLTHSEGTDRADMNFSIVSDEEAHVYAYEAGLLQGAPVPRSSIGDRLLGKWRFVSPDPGAPKPELTIKKENDKLVARFFRKDARTHWVKLRKNANTLILRSKSEELTGDCWFVVEDVITFNSRMDNMSVRSRILEGNRCVSIGEASESKLSRIH